MKVVEILGLQILSDFTKTHTYSSLSRPQKLSIGTTKAYLDCFQRAYLFFESKFFSYKTKVTQDTQKARKIYVADNGLRNFNTPLLRPDLGQCAENITYMELRKQGGTTYYWKGKQKIDIEGLKEFNLDGGVILTKNYYDTKKVEGKTIQFVPLWDWLIYLSQR